MPDNVHRAVPTRYLYPVIGALAVIVIVLLVRPHAPASPFGESAGASTQTTASGISPGMEKIVSELESAYAQNLLSQQNHLFNEAVQTARTFEDAELLFSTVVRFEQPNSPHMAETAQVWMQKAASVDQQIIMANDQGRAFLSTRNGLR